MKKTAVNEKEQKFEEVSRTLFALLQTVGPAKITHSVVAKRAGVSRAWLYKYVGSKKEDLMVMAIQHLGKRLTERDLNDVITTKAELRESIVLGMQRMFENTRDYPWFIPVYFKFRGSPTAIGETIAGVEQDYIARQAKHFEKVFRYSKKQAVVAAEILTSFRMGLAFSWQHGELSKKSDQKEVLRSIEAWINELFSA
jgi:AcrR family transcriptional regulator